MTFYKQLCDTINMKIWKSGHILGEKRRPEMYIVYIRRNGGVEQIWRPNSPRITYTLELWRTSVSSPTPRNALEYLSEVECAVYIPFSA